MGRSAQKRCETLQPRLGRWAAARSSRGGQTGQDNLGKGDESETALGGDLGRRAEWWQKIMSSWHLKGLRDS